MVFVIRRNNSQNRKS